MTLEDVGYEEVCPACIPHDMDCLMGFEKVVDLENVGLVIYRRAGNSKNVIRDKKGSVGIANKTVIVHNTRENDITSEDFLREMQTRKVACPRCRQIIELALKLLRKVPAINKKAILGICDHCKIKGPCLGCKETVRKFLSEYEAKAIQEQAIEKQSKIKYVPEDYFIDKERKQQRGSAKLLIEELLHRKYSSTVKRELEICDLFRRPKSEFEISDLFRSPKREFEINDQFLRPQTPRSTKSLPFIDEDKKHLKLETVSRPFIKPSRDSKITVQKEGKVIFAPDVYLTDLDDNLKKSTYSPSTSQDHYKTQRIPKQRLKDFVPILHPDKQGLDIESITTDDKTLIEPPPVFHVPKRKRQKDEDIFPDHPLLIAHEREKYGQKDTDGKYLKTIEKLYIEDKATKPTQLPRDRNSELEEKYYILKKGNKLLDFTPTSSYEVEKQQQEFSFSFYHDTPKPENELIACQKTSIELIKETQDLLQVQSQEIKRKNIESRLQKEEELEKKRLAQEEKARLMREKKPEADRKKNILEEMNQMELDLFKELRQTEQRKSSIEVRMATSIKNKIQNGQFTKPISKFDPKNIEAAGTKTQLTKFKSPKDFEGQIQKELEDNKQKELEDKNLNDLDGKIPKELEYIKLKELENKSSKASQQPQPQQYKSGTANKNEQALTKYEKDKEKAMFNKQNEKEKTNSKDKKEHLKEFDNENKGVQTLKQNQEFLMDELKRPKKTFKAQDTKQLARMQKDDKKTDTSTTTIMSTDKTKKQQYKSTKDRAKTKKDIGFDKIKVQCPNEMGVLVKFKENSTGPRYTYMGKTLREHWDIHETCHQIISDPLCPFCLHSDLELNVELRKQKTITSECIKGQKIVDINKAPETDEHDKTPILFHTNYDIPVFNIGDNEKTWYAKSGSPITEEKGQNTTSGVTRYALSDRTFIDKGWTVLPTEKVMRKMNVYRMRPAKPEFDWFKRHKDKEKFYNSGERFVEHQEDGRCRWFYKNDRLALDYYDASELNAQQRFVIYSNGEPDERGRARPYTVLAMFDYLGNGVVFDHGGKIRLKYNQTEGVVLDRSIGPVSHWKWHTLNDPPVLQQVMIDTQLSHKDPNILKMGEKEVTNRKDNSDNEEMTAIEFDNFVKEKSQKLSQNFKPFQIRMKAMKINENFSLKVLDQANVYLIFRDGTTNVKVNIGMMLDHKEIIDTDTIEVGDVANSLERLPARTDSLAAMQKSVAYAQHFEKTRTERERRLRLPEQSASADELTAAASRPIRPPLRAFNPSVTTSKTNSAKSYKIPLSNNVYYSTI